MKQYTVSMLSKKKTNFLYAKIVPSGEVPPTVKWLIKRRVVRTAGQANVLLLLIIIGASLAAYTVFPRDDRPHAYIAGPDFFDTLE